MSAPPKDPTRRSVTTPSSSRRVPGSVVALVAGDLIAFALFAIEGRIAHKQDLSVSGIGLTALPFALGWFAVSPWLGAFRSALVANPRAMLLRTELAWVLAWPVTLLLRWALADDHNVPVSFAVVILLVNAALLGAWRTGFALVNGRRRARR